MIPVNSQVLYEDALQCLATHKQAVGHEFKGRFIQIFLGLKFFQDSLPSIYSGSFVSTSVLQSLLDDLYSKSSRMPNESVLALFERNYLPRTGLAVPGKGPQNTWRNNFNFQKGIGCFAPVADLSSRVFLNQDRVNCRHLDSPVQGSLREAECTLCPGRKYRGENHRKWLRIDPGGNGYAVLDLQDTANFEPYVAHLENRIPILPLIVALYHDADPGLVLGTRQNVGLADFMADFNFSTNEISTYFDISMESPINLQLKFSAGWKRGSSLGTELRATPPPIVRPRANAQAPRVRRVPPGAPNLNGTQTPPPAINTGWEAEQFAATALAANGWTPYVVSRQQLGYDIFAKKGRKNIYVEVKSSVGQCSPTLTSREWQQAIAHAGSYILAIVENFNPLTQNTVYWISDPANTCVASQQTTISHSISRSSWVIATVPLNRI